MPDLYWPVYGFGGPGVEAGQFGTKREVVACFPEWGDAASFASDPSRFGAEKRNLFIGSARAKGNRANVG